MPAADSGLTLIRLDNLTRGVLLVAGQVYYTTERPWLDNEPNVSCVPVGSYRLEPHSSDRYPDTWALVGETVAHYDERPGIPRFTCLLHVANEPIDVEGCIGPGLRSTASGNSSSSYAMAALRALRDSGADPFERLEIVNGWDLYGR